MRVLGRLALAAVGLFAGFLAVGALREATMSTHYHVSPDSRTRVVLRASTHRGQSGQSLDEMVEAALLLCRLEVSSDISGAAEPQPGPEGTYEVMVRPALDETNRRQLRGCLQDWRVDHLRVDVVRMVTI
jgi:hypothetical protein